MPCRRDARLPGLESIRECRVPVCLRSCWDGDGTGPRAGRSSQGRRQRRDSFISEGGRRHEGAHGQGGTAKREMTCRQRQASHRDAWPGRAMGNGRAGGSRQKTRPSPIASGGDRPTRPCDGDGGPLLVCGGPGARSPGRTPSCSANGPGS